MLLTLICQSGSVENGIMLLNKIMSIIITSTISCKSTLKTVEKGQQ